MRLNNKRTVLALFLLPFFGGVSDRWSGRLGRRMLFILFGTALAAVLMNILPVLDNSFYRDPVRAKATAFVAVLGLLLVAMGIYRSPAVALMPDITPKPLRSRANAIINLMGAVGGALYLGIAAVMYPTSKTRLQPHVDYLPLFVIVSLLMLASVAVMLFTIREPELAEENRAIENEHPEWDLSEDDGSGSAAFRTICQGHNERKLKTPENTVFSNNFVVLHSLNTNIPLFFLGLHIILYQTDNLVVHALPALLAVMA